MLLSYVHTCFIVKRLFLGAILLAAGCVNSQQIKPRIDVLSQYLRKSETAQQHIVRAVDPCVSNGHECGGAIVRDPDFRLITIPNTYSRLPLYVSECGDGNFRNRHNLFSLLASARPVHAYNKSYGIVAHIDIAMQWQYASEWTPTAQATVNTVVNCFVVPSTYRPSYHPKNVVMWWHTHPNSTGPSKFDVDNASEPFGVARRVAEGVEITLVDKGQRRSIYLPSGSTDLARNR